MYCDYECGNVGNFILKNGKRCCSKSHNSCPALKDKNSRGLKSAYLSGKRPSMIVTYNSLPDETKKKMNWNKENYQGTIFEYGGTGSHKAVLIKERGHRCEDCGLSEWKSQPIPLELEHSDGDNRNNTRENLKLLCCNCHALTPTWRGRNMNSGKKKVSDEELLTALKETRNIRQALQMVGLTPKGGNYERANKLKTKISENSSSKGLTIDSNDV
jgi:hypothetical protein